MLPAELLGIAALLPAAAGVIDAMLRRRRQRRLVQLAQSRRMHYSPSDQFRLTPRVARHFPIPGAAKLRIADLIYSLDRDIYRYVFTAEYTAGVLSGKHRVQRVASLSEPRERPGQPSTPRIELAPAHLTLSEQYASLLPLADELRQGENNANGNQDRPLNERL